MITGKTYFRLCSLCSIYFFTAQLLWGGEDFINDKVAAADNGTVAIVCHTTPQQGGRIFLVIMDSTDTFLCDPVPVNSKLRGYGQNADVGIDSQGKITIVWEQIETNAPAIYWAQFLSNGSEVTPPVLITDSITIAVTPRLSVHPEGCWIANWLDYRLGRPAIFAQRFSSDGKPSGRNFFVAGSSSLIQYPNVRIAKDSTLLFGWQDSGHGHFRVKVQFFGWNAAALSDTISIDNSGGKASASNPELLLQPNGESIVLWKDYREGESNIYLQRLKKKKLLSGNQMVNDDSTHRWQRLSCIAGSHSGKFICVWEDYRNDGKNQIGDIYAQLYSPSGKKVGKNIKINSGPEPTVQEFPSVAMNSNGNGVITWNDARNKEIQVFMKRFRLTINTAGPEKMVVPRYE